MPIPEVTSRLLPGLVLCLAVAAAAWGAEALERHVAGTAPLEALVLAIVFGAAWRAARPPAARDLPGIAFGSRRLLEVAVVLLGAALSGPAVFADGVRLPLLIAAVVAASLAASFAIGRFLGLSPALATLVACGNSICGNSAIVAVAPAIGASPAEIGTAIAGTAAGGVVLVLMLPLAAPLLHLSAASYGAFAGLTVYAVPQVLAATAPAGAAAIQLGTLVKLARVLLLGPVVAGLSLAYPAAGVARPGLARIVPPFIVGFLLLAVLRSAGVLPHALVAPAAAAANLLGTVSMAGLGLSTDLLAARRAGRRVAAAVALSLAVLLALSLGCVALLGR